MWIGSCEFFLDILFILSRQNSLKICLGKKIASRIRKKKNTVYTRKSPKIVEFIWRRNKNFNREKVYKRMCSCWEPESLCMCTETRDRIKRVKEEKRKRICLLIEQTKGCVTTMNETKKKELNFGNEIRKLVTSTLNRNKTKLIPILQRNSRLLQDSGMLCIFHCLCVCLCH